jgi:xanthine dehydrogenase molybdopterin-binding subunit B
LLKSVGIRFAVFDIGQGACCLFSSHAIAFEGDTVGVVDDPVEDGICDGWLAAALLEEFVYDEEGQLLTQSFMDYLLPSSHEVAKVEIVHHCTPSPYTVFGQKGSGESGYLGAPAAISSAINDAVASLGISFSKLPIRIAAISDAIAVAQDSQKQDSQKKVQQ